MAFLAVFLGMSWGFLLFSVPVGSLLMLLMQERHRFGWPSLGLATQIGHLRMGRAAGRG